HALHLALASGMPLALALVALGVCTLLFAAMGLLFIGGFGVSGSLPGTRARVWALPPHLIPGFNEQVFLAFVLLAFVVQVAFAPRLMSLPAAHQLDAAMAFAVPGQRILLRTLDACSMDGGRTFAAAFTWVLAIIWLASALSRLKLLA